MTLDIRNITIVYGRTASVQDVSISVQAGVTVSLLGPNGAGKSTVLKAIMGLGDCRIDSGNVFVSGEEVTGMKPHQVIEKGISYLPQGNAVFNTLTVEENLKIALNAGRLSKPELTGVYDRFPVLFESRKRPASSLSGGERQILGLARALVTKPKLLLLDEPTIGLSPSHGVKVFERIKSLNKDGTSVLLVEQRVAEAIEVADRVYIMKAGKIFFTGERDEVRSSKQLKEAFLGG